MACMVIPCFLFERYELLETGVVIGLRERQSQALAHKGLLKPNGRLIGDINMRDEGAVTIPPVASKSNFDFPAEDLRPQITRGG